VGVLFDVSVSGANAIAVGSAGVFRATGIGSKDAGGLVWTQLDAASSAMSVALHRDKGLVGYSDGRIRTIDAAAGTIGDELASSAELSTGGDSEPIDLPLSPRAGRVPVNGLAMTSETRGIAVTGQAGLASRVYELRTTQTQTVPVGDPAAATVRAPLQVLPAELLIRPSAAGGSATCR
jgi:hypothetical protein